MPAEAMNLYPGQLQAIIVYLEALDRADKDIHDLSLDSSLGVLLDKVPVLESEGDALLGHLVDEIGGAWSFRATVTGLENRA